MGVVRLRALLTAIVACCVVLVTWGALADSRLINIATRGFVGTDDDVMIGGFIISGNEPKTVVIRAIGPSLDDFNVLGVLVDPHLDLFSGPTLIDSNDDWEDHGSSAQIPEALIPTRQLEAAIYTTLTPGAYTVVVSGYNASVGVGLVEVFEVADDCHGHLSQGRPGQSDQILCRQGYALGYNYARKSADWVAYRLTPEIHDSGNVSRQDDFRSDSEIPQIYQTTLSDYDEPIYDRGHLANSASLDATVSMNSETFLLSNMVPQLPGFNRAAWLALENRERIWTDARQELFIYAGVLFEGDQVSFIGDGVPIPTHFYKIIFDPETHDVTSFLFPHMDIATSDLDLYSVSVDEIELRSGLNFLTALPDAEEETIERAVIADLESYDPSASESEPTQTDILTDADIREAIIGQSIQDYSGSCPCPYSRASDGSQCGGRSAYSTPGGASPICYEEDISDEMVEEYRENRL